MPHSAVARANILFGVAATSTLLYPCLCWNDAETRWSTQRANVYKDHLDGQYKDQHKEPTYRYKDHLDGQLATHLILLDGEMSFIVRAVKRYLLCKSNTRAGNSSGSK